MAYMYRTVMNMYDGEKWRWRVRNMSDNQIMAIFYKDLERKENRLKLAEEEAKAAANVRATRSALDEYPKQLSFFD